jgi:hypothetical protein
MDLHKALESVTDLPSFLTFAQFLAADRADEARKEAIQPSHFAGPGVNGWENGSIEDFLDAAIRWAEATDMGLSQGLSAENPWKRFAVFLYCGKIYE